MRGEPIPCLRVMFSEALFQSPPHARGDEAGVRKQFIHFSISIHAPHARGDASYQSAHFRMFISIHAPHARGDFVGLPHGFLGTISIHAPHARGDVTDKSGSNPLIISIHAPHARGDCCIYADGGIQYISIHAPHARGDYMFVIYIVSLPKFQSTPLMRGATIRKHGLSTDINHFNPRPSCEGRPV